MYVQDCRLNCISSKTKTNMGTQCWGGCPSIKLCPLDSNQVRVEMSQIPAIFFWGVKEKGNPFRINIQSNSPKGLLHQFKVLIARVLDVHKHRC